MSILSSAPACLTAVVAARQELHHDGWSLDTIADDIEADERWAPAPHGIYGLVVVKDRRSVVTIAEHVRRTEQETYVRARLLAEVIAARALDQSHPYAGVVLRKAWRDDPTRRPYWAGASMLAVSLADVGDMVAGLATPAEIGARRDVPGWLAELRVTQERMYGTIEGDATAALCRIVQISERMLEWIGKANGCRKVQV